MDQEALRIKVTEAVKQLMDSISAGEFDKIPSNVDIDESWYSGGMTREDALAEFKDWLDGQLDLWREEYGTDFVIDAFREESLAAEDLDLVEYNPTSNGERLDFWFEIDVRNREDETPLIVFNVNI